MGISIENGWFNYLQLFHQDPLKNYTTKSIFFGSYNHANVSYQRDIIVGFGNDGYPKKVVVRQQTDHQHRDGIWNVPC